MKEPEPMRCKACDAVMTDIDMDRVNDVTKLPEELCGVCLRYVHDLDSDFVDMCLNSFDEFFEEYDDGKDYS